MFKPSVEIFDYSNIIQWNSKQELNISSNGKYITQINFFNEINYVWRLALL